MHTASATTPSGAPGQRPTPSPRDIAPRPRQGSGSVMYTTVSAGLASAMPPPAPPAPRIGEPTEAVPSPATPVPPADEQDDKAESFKRTYALRTSGSADELELDEKRLGTLISTLQDLEGVTSVSADKKILVVEMLCTPDMASSHHRTCIREVKAYNGYNGTNRNKR